MDVFVRQVLDEDELLALVDRLETPMSHAEIRQAMHDMDEDSDEVRLCSLALSWLDLMCADVVARHGPAWMSCSSSRKVA